MLKQLNLLFKTHQGLVTILALFLVIQLALVWSGGYNEVFNSPDANINFHFSKQLALTKHLGFDTFDSSVAEFVAPRSARVINGQIVPVSFLGLISFYGFLGSMFTTGIIPYLTILFAVVAMVYFYLLIKKLFNLQVAWWTTFLLAIHPAWFYYTNRSLLPNILFLSLLIIGFYYLYAISNRTEKKDFFLAGFFISAALLVRSSEVVWVLGIVLIYLYYERKRIFFSKLVWSLIGVVPFVAIGLVYFLTSYQGSPSLGYSVVNEESSLLTIIKRIIFPFGFNPRLIYDVFVSYVLLFFAPFTILSIAGLVSIKKFFNNRRQFFYTGAWVITSVYLLIYYGSWFITDSPDPTQVTIGTSYVRYFLPVYIFALPFLAWLLLKLSSYLLPNQRKFFLIFMSVALITFSFSITVFDKQEGILAQRENLKVYDLTSSAIASYVNDQDIILTEKADKYLWPKYNVIVPSGDNNYLSAVKTLMDEEHRVFFLHLDMTSAGEEVFNQRWQDYGFKLEDKLYSGHDLALYSLTSL